jgi:hypothetical protein
MAALIPSDYAGSVRLAAESKGVNAADLSYVDPRFRLLLAICLTVATNFVRHGETRPTMAWTEERTDEKKGIEKSDSAQRFKIVHSVQVLA